MDTLPICKALSKRSGLRCKNFATKGKRVCRMHGGKSTGARTQWGKARQEMASWKHGMRSKAAIEEARVVSLLIRRGKEEIQSLRS